MSKSISTLYTTRVNINIPVDLVDKVKEYAKVKGFNVTSAYISLLNQALTTNYILEKLPELVNLYQVIDSTLSDDEKNEIDNNSLKELLTERSEN